MDKQAYKSRISSAGIFTGSLLGYVLANAITSGLDLGPRGRGYGALGGALLGGGAGYLASDPILKAKTVLFPHIYAKTKYKDKVDYPIETSDVTGVAPIIAGGAIGDILGGTAGYLLSGGSLKGAFLGGLLSGGVGAYTGSKLVPSVNKWLGVVDTYEEKLKRGEIPGMGKESSCKLLSEMIFEKRALTTAPLMLQESLKHDNGLEGAGIGAIRSYPVDLGIGMGGSLGAIAGGFMGNNSRAALAGLGIGALAGGGLGYMSSDYLLKLLLGKERYNEVFDKEKQMRDKKKAIT